MKLFKRVIVYGGSEIEERGYARIDGNMWNVKVKRRRKQ